MIFKKLFIALLASMALFAAYGCEQEGPIEEAGESLEETAEETKEAINE